MIKVKMIKTASGPQGSYLQGKVYTMDSETAKSFTENEACVILGLEEKKVKPEPPKKEGKKVEPEEPKVEQKLPANKPPAKHRPGRK